MLAAAHGCPQASKAASDSPPRKMTRPRRNGCCLSHSLRLPVPTNWRRAAARDGPAAAAGGRTMTIAPIVGQGTQYARR